VFEPRCDRRWAVDPVQAGLQRPLRESPGRCGRVTSVFPLHNPYKCWSGDCGAIPA
jgi:hypothetical protein